MNMLDNIPEPHPFLGKKSRLIHNSAKYDACIINVGLVVQSKRGNGTLLPVIHPQYLDYVQALETAIDNSEADALCKALLS